MSARVVRPGGVHGSVSSHRQPAVAGLALQSSSLVRALCCAFVLLATVPARAEGRVFNPGGTKALARGGAVVARPDDPLALHHNPAGLALLEGNQGYLGADVPFFSACVEPIGYYGWGVYQPGVSEFGDSGQVDVDAQGNPLPGQYLNTPLHEVCNSSDVAPIPQLAVTMRLGERWGIGFGFVGPSVLAGQQWGGADATISRDGRTWPTPTRYQLVQERFTFAYNPTLGVAYRLASNVSIGANVQWLGIGVENTVVQALEAGTSPHNDAFVRVRASDYFIPAATAAVHVKPAPPLDVAVAFHWFDSFDGSGEAIFTTNNYYTDVPVGGVPHENPPIELERVHMPLPWQLVAGVRYAEPLAKTPATLERGAPKKDPLATELFDVELDVAVTFNARASVTTVMVANTCDLDASGNRIPTGLGTPARGCQSMVFKRNEFVGTELETITTREEVPPEGFESSTLDRHWENQVAVRLGGSFTALPNRLQIHAGAYYETRGVDPAYASIDNMLFSRIGVGTGVVVRVGRFDLMAAYGHIFQETLEVGAPAHASRTTATGEPSNGFDKRIGECPVGQAGCPLETPLEETNAPSDPDATAAQRQGSFVETPSQQARVINAGIYRASFDIVSVGVALHF